MKVIIAEKEVEYVSDFPDGWKFISKDYFKYPVQVGSRDCFIKRFQVAQVEAIPGWDLLLKLKYKKTKK